MGAFAEQQEQMRRAMEQAMGGFYAVPGLEEVRQQNIAMMERAMSLFSPFRQPEAPQTIESLKAEVESLRLQLAELKRTSPDTSRGG